MRSMSRFAFAIAFIFSWSMLAGPVAATTPAKTPVAATTPATTPTLAQPVRYLQPDPIADDDDVDAGVLEDDPVEQELEEQAQEETGGMEFESEQPGDTESATIEEDEEQGFETEPVGEEKAKKPPVNPCTLSHKSVFYDNDFSYLDDPEYHGHCLGDCWKLMPVGPCGRLWHARHRRPDPPALSP